MSAELDLLCRAADRMRADHGPEHVRNEMWSAMADWLENAAEDIEMQGPGGDLVKNWDMRVHINGAKALAVARAYLKAAS